MEVHDIEGGQNPPPLSKSNPPFYFNSNLPQKPNNQATACVREKVGFQDKQMTHRQTTHSETKLL